MPESIPRAGSDRTRFRYIVLRYKRSVDRRRREMVDGTEAPRPRFSRGMEDETDRPDKDVRPRFSRGQERPSNDPERNHEGDFSTGQARAPHHPERELHGRFSRGSARSSLRPARSAHGCQINAADDRSEQRVGDEPRGNGRSRVIADGMCLPRPALGVRRPHVGECGDGSPASLYFCSSAFWSSRAGIAEQQYTRNGSPPTITTSSAPSSAPARSTTGSGARGRRSQ